MHSLTAAPTVQIVASRAFTIRMPAQLLFRYFVRASGTTQMHLCINSLETCVWHRQRPKRGLEAWWTATVPIKTGRNQVEQYATT
jgi:hypothetical protein